MRSRAIAVALAAALGLASGCAYQPQYGPDIDRLPFERFGPRPMAAPGAAAGSPLVSPPVGRPASLVDCVAMAVANNAAVIDAGQGIRVAEIAIDLATSIVLPKVTVGLDLSSRNESNNIKQGGIVVNTAPRDLQSLYTAFQIPVYDFGASRAILEQTQVGVERAKLRVQMTKLQLVAVVEQAFHGAAAIGAQLRALDELVASLTRQASDVRARFANGVVTEDAVLLIEHSLRDATWRRAEAERWRTQAVWRLARVCGLEHDSGLMLDDVLPEPTASVPEFAQLFGNALQQRPDALDLKLEARQSNLQRTVVDAEYWPKLGITGALVSSSNDRLVNKTWLEMTLSARWIVYSGNDTAARSETWGIQRDLLERREREFQRTLAIDIAIARDSALLAADRLSLRRAGIDPARRHRDLVESRFKAGTATASELAEGNRLLAQAEVDADLARLELSAAQMRLETAASMPLLTTFFQTAEVPADSHAETTP